MYKLKTVLMGAVMSVAAGLSANAATLTFDTASGVPFSTHTEAGFNVSDGGQYIVADAGSMHFDISGGPYSLSRTIAANSGSAFSVMSLDIGSIWPNISGGLLGAPMANIAFTGYLGGSAVAYAWGSSEIGNNTFSFGSAFGNIDSFSIAGFISGNVDYNLGIDVHFTIDNISIAMVPLPATALLLIASLGGLGFARRRPKV